MQTQDEKEDDRQRAWLIGVLALGLVNLGGLGLLVARAAPGIAGKSRDTLTFVGTLKGVPSRTQPMTFRFKKPGVRPCEVKPQAPVDSNGAFSVDLDIGLCSTTLFDGAEVTVDVLVGDSMVAMDKSINPVPYARFADRVGTPDCPVGYEKSADPQDTMNGQFTICQKQTNGKPYDEVVRVGSGQSAFWIDRYEASLYKSPDSNGLKLDPNDPNVQATFPKNGQWQGTQPPVFALSRVNVPPTVTMTWFQAMEACAANGKRLPSRQEWLLAARGTVDPGSSGGDAGTCLTSAGGMRDTGDGTACVSGWGAQDMIGNLWEWTDEWDSGLGTTDAGGPWKDTSGGGAYHGDVISGITSSAYPGDNRPRVDGANLPGAMLRGGSWQNGTQSGIFALQLLLAPSAWGESVGFRCVIRR